jgi:uncharacterized protein YceH (UPF0502 family)
MTLSVPEIRVLATLIEKEITTPEYYPMTLNALTNACNQKTNRDPVTNLDETDVIEAFDKLVKQGLARFVDEGASRVAKHRQRLVETLKLTSAQTAILCELMLRGPQTTGELKGRAERMHSCADLVEVETVLNALAARSHEGTPEPLVVRLPRQAGQKEARWMHLLGGEPDMALMAMHIPAKNNEPDATNPRGVQEERIAHLEEQVSILKAELRTLREEFTAFKRQFE